MTAPLSLSLPADASFLHVATSFADKASGSLGLHKGGVLSLTLAVEEIFNHLCRFGSPDQAIRIECVGGSYYVRMDFLFKAGDFPLRAFNLTATVNPEDEASLDEMGLMLASRSVDRFQVTEAPGQPVRLTLIKEKSYPELDETQPGAVGRIEGFAIRVPDPAEIKFWAGLVSGHYARRGFPPFFRMPGKLADMIGGGEYQAALAFGPSGQVGGGILWRWIGPQTAECFGPYVFAESDTGDLAEGLLEHCINALARTRCLGLINRWPTAELPREYFQDLGRLTVQAGGKARVDVTAYFRQMHEDSGSEVWCHPDLEAYLRAEYRRLALPREIRPVRDQGERRERFSVISAEIDRYYKEAVLRPVLSGTDIADNLAEHLALLQRERLTGVFFEMDLGVSRHADFTPHLLKAGFRPRFIMPNAGRGDVIVFQFEGGAA